MTFISLLFYLQMLIYLIKLNILLLFPLKILKLIYLIFIYLIYLDFFMMSIIIPLIISVAYITLVERKVIGLCNYV